MDEIKIGDFVSGKETKRGTTRQGIYLGKVRNQFLILAWDDTSVMLDSVGKQEVPNPTNRLGAWYYGWRVRNGMGN